MTSKTITLTGGEQKVIYGSGCNAWLRNDGTEAVYASCSPGLSAGGDGVVLIPAGQSAPVFGANGTVYLLGTGSVQLVGTDYSSNPFKTSAQSGGSGADEVARTAISSHSANAEIHVTAAEKTAWNGKADKADISELEAYIGYTDNDIYGVEVDFANKKFTRLAGAVNRSAGTGFDSINAFGGRKRCNVTDDGTVTAYYGEAGFTTTGKNTEGIAVQVMVEQPKFYYKVVPMVCEKADQGMKIRKARYYVSDTPKTGFKVHPAFVENGNENDKIYLAAFEGSIYDNSASAYITDDSAGVDFAEDMLSSIGGVTPVSGTNNTLTRANARLASHNRGSGWEQAYAATVAASQLLMLIEYAAFNMQNAIGKGTGDKTTTDLELTGTTVTLGNNSGVIVNDNGWEMITYRGEENLWSNALHWVDGMNGYAPDSFAEGDFKTLFVADHDFSDDTDNSPYSNTGINIPYCWGAYISAFGYSEKYDWLFIPAECLGDSSLPVGDVCYNNRAGWSVGQHGGRNAYGDRNGAFLSSITNKSEHYHWSCGGRLVFIPTKSGKGA